MLTHRLTYRTIFMLSSHFESLFTSHTNEIVNLRKCTSQIVHIPESKTLQLETKKLLH